jgi:WD40 repeat protein
MRDQDQLTQLVQDARRFIMYHKGAIESYPLQTYASALLFSPTGSLIRRLFQHEEPQEIAIRPAMSVGWSACLQTLEGHSDPVWSVAFSHDSTQLASASYDGIVKIWDASSGACMQSLESHSSTVGSVAFSHDSAQLASAYWDNTVKIWDASSGVCMQTLNIGQVLHNLSFDSTARFLYTETGTIVIQSLEISSMKDTEEPKRPLYQDINLNLDRIWVKHADNNMLWIPSEYRPSCSTVCGTMVGMGVRSGRVWSCRIDLQYLQ